MGSSYNYYTINIFLSKGMVNGHVMQASNDMITNESYSRQELFWATEAVGQSDRELYSTIAPSSAHNFGMDTGQGGQ